MNEAKFLTDPEGIKSATITHLIQLPKQYNWSPKEDITAYELALAVPILIYARHGDIENLVNGLPENCRRHFEEV